MSKILNHNLDIANSEKDPNTAVLYNLDTHEAIFVPLGKWMFSQSKNGGAKRASFCCFRLKRFAPAIYEVEFLRFYNNITEAVASNVVGVNVDIDLSENPMSFNVFCCVKKVHILELSLMVLNAIDDVLVSELDETWIPTVEGYTTNFLTTFFTIKNG
jgi:hypothetical protein